MVFVHRAWLLSGQSGFRRLHAWQSTFHQDDASAREWKAFYRIGRKQFCEEYLYSVGNIEWKAADDSGDTLRRHRGWRIAKAGDGTCALQVGFQLDTSPTTRSCNTKFLKDLL